MDTGRYEEEGEISLSRRSSQVIPPLSLLLLLFSSPPLPLPSRGEVGGGGRERVVGREGRVEGRERVVGREGGRERVGQRVVGREGKGGW